ncbi:MAG: MFS transporter, partial [Frankiaceae bacterium]|nr:MFS transporter [Frankiaceae bacterium]
MTEPALAHRRALLVLAGAGLLLLMVAGGAPSPLYSWYQERIGFPAGTLTMIFAIYALALLVSLMVFGALSDYVGRKPVLVAALGTQAGAMALFLPAHSVGMLLSARAAQGVATGAAVATYGAALIDAQRPGSDAGAIINATFPSLGLGIGALFAGFAMRWSPRPADAVFGFLVAAFVLLAVIVAAAPESGPRRPGALGALRPTLAAPAHVRPTLVLLIPTLLGIWAISGLFFSLGPSIAIGIFGQRGSLAGASVIAAMTFSGTAMVFVVRSAPARAMMLGGSAALIVGPGLLLAALGAGSMAVFYLGSAVTGAGFSTVFYGIVRTVGALARPQERAG